MAKYKDKWKTTFPTSIGNQTRPEDSVDNTQEYNTDGLPQYMANDPVRYDLQNAVNSQLVSNDERLNEKIKRTSDDLAAHNKDPKAHATGIAGNAATASKLLTPRTISLTGKAAGSTSFDGSSNAAINVTSVNADTASKLSTARKINITGNATGSASFDGSADISISTIVNESKHAAAADTLKSSAATETSTVARPVWLSWEGDNTKQTVSPNLTYTCSTKTLKAANFDGHLAGNADSATTANSLKETLDRPASANVTYNDGKIRYFLATANMSEGKPSGGDGPVIHLSWDRPLWESQIAINNPSGHIQTRTQDNGTWGSWKTVLDSDNFNNYAPTKTGGGASGTWGISISGNAASATNADTVDGYHASDLLSKIYPVGSIYMSMSATNPHDLFGVGTWKRISQGRMLLGADDSTYKAGATGGEATHTLTAAEMPAHSHGISTSGDHSHYFYGSDNNNGPLTEGDGLDTEANLHYTKNVRFTTSSAGAHTHTISNSGGGAAHNNMPPYLVCYIWQRTA